MSLLKLVTETITNVNYYFQTEQTINTSAILSRLNKRNQSTFCIFFIEEIFEKLSISFYRYDESIINIYNTKSKIRTDTRTQSLFYGEWGKLRSAIPAISTVRKHAMSFADNYHDNSKWWMNEWNHNKCIFMKVELLTVADSLSAIQHTGNQCYTNIEYHKSIESQNRTYRYQNVNVQSQPALSSCS